MRNVLLAAALTLTAAGPASAAFVGVAIREDKSLPPAAVPAGIRVFNLYATFDGPGDDATLEGRPNSLIAVITPDVDPGQPLSFFGLNLGQNPGANFYNAPIISGARDAAPDLAFGDPRAQYDTFFSIGLKSINSATGPVFNDQTMFSPTFSQADSDGLATDGHAFDRIQGDGGVLWGAFINSGQGFPKFNDSTGVWETVFAQVAALGVAPGSAIGSQQPLTYFDGESGVESSSVFASDIFAGSIALVAGGALDGAVFHRVQFVPAPGATPLLLAAAIAASRRKRRGG